MHKEASAKIGDSRLDTVHKALDSRDAVGYDVKKHIWKSECELLIKRADRFIYWVRRILDT